jgi:protein disulfide-isomerase A6
MGVQGFPTLKIVKPGKKPGRPIVEDYQGAREAKAIIEAVTSKITNHVTKLTDKDLETFLAENNDTAKAILFTEKGATSSLWKAVAIDFLGSIKVAQIRNKETASAELFGIKNFPTIVLLPGGTTEAITYDSEMKKDAITSFLSQVHPPNPDPAPPKTKASKEKKAEKKAEKKERKKEAEAAKESFESSSTSHKSSEASSAAASATAEEDSKPTESPSPEVEAEKPIALEETTPPIPVITNAKELAAACLAPKAGTCVLAFIPSARGDIAVQGISSLAEVAEKYNKLKRNIFPLYTIPEETKGSSELKATLGLTGEVEIVAINAKRGWMRKYSGSEYGQEAIENWIDAIRMGEGEKTILPGILIGKTPEAVPEPSTAESAPDATPEPFEEPQSTEAVTPEEPAEPTPEADPESIPTAEDIPSTSVETTTSTAKAAEPEKMAPAHNEL